MVPGAGLEPARCYHRGILSPLRLPISPPGHIDGLACKTSRCTVHLSEAGASIHDQYPLWERLNPHYRYFFSIALVTCHTSA